MLIRLHTGYLLYIARRTPDADFKQYIPRASDIALIEDG
jgi:hypothetical protein